MKRNYNDPIYKKWIKDIFIRDDFKCQWPGCKFKSKLNAHHIFRWADFPGLRYHANNGITLCKIHHKQITGDEDSYTQFFSSLLINKNKKEK